MHEAIVECACEDVGDGAVATGRALLEVEQSLGGPEGEGGEGGEHKVEPEEEDEADTCEDAGVEVVVELPEDNPGEEGDRSRAAELYPQQERVAHHLARLARAQHAHLQYKA